MTHAFFKALLFLAAGSVIIAMHHDQDIRNMGGLRKYMPVTWIAFLIGTLALTGFPGLAGSFSKDAIIEAVEESAITGADYASVLLTFGVAITALYSFRLYFLVFHGKERMDDHTRHHLQESPWVVTVPLVLLAVLSAVSGWLAMGPLLIGDWFAGAIYVAPIHDVLLEIREDYRGPLQFVLHGLHSEVFYYSMTGTALGALVWWYLQAKNPRIDEQLQTMGGPVTRALQNKYGFDDFNQRVFGEGGQSIGKMLWTRGDQVAIDGFMVNGSAHSVGRLAAVARHIQTGYLYHYAIAMIVGLVGLLTVFVTL
jgi:NADH-quinone oxidoreductase subunit L